MLDLIRLMTFLLVFPGIAMARPNGPAHRVFQPTVDCLWPILSPIELDQLSAVISDLDRHVIREAVRACDLDFIGQSIRSNVTSLRKLNWKKVQRDAIQVGCCPVAEVIEQRVFHDTKTICQKGPGNMRPHPVSGRKNGAPPVVFSGTSLSVKLLSDSRVEGAFNPSDRTANLKLETGKIPLIDTEVGEGRLKVETVGAYRFGLSQKAATWEKKGVELTYDRWADRARFKLAYAEDGPAESSVRAQYEQSAFGFCFDLRGEHRRSASGKDGAQVFGRIKTCR